MADQITRLLEQAWLERTVLMAGGGLRSWSPRFEDRSQQDSCGQEYLDNRLSTSMEFQDAHFGLHLVAVGLLLTGFTNCSRWHRRAHHPV